MKIIVMNSADLRIGVLDVADNMPQRTSSSSWQSTTIR